MSVSSVTPTVNPSSMAAPTKNRATLTQADFMNLFITQMKFQNPLQPLDNNQMATQMAQFNTVDALATMNKTLNQMMTNQASLNNLQATSLIGKKVEARGNTLSIQEGMVSSGAYQLARPGNVLIQIFDSNGNLVQQMTPGYKDTSVQSIGWNGKNQQGMALPDGTYTFKVLGADQKGQAVTANTYLLGTVGGVSLENGTAYFQMGGNRISLSDILAILN